MVDKSLEMVERRSHFEPFISWENWGEKKNASYCILNSFERLLSIIWLAFGLFCYFLFMSFGSLNSNSSFGSQFGWNFSLISVCCWHLIYIWLSMFCFTEEKRCYRRENIRINMHLFWFHHIHASQVIWLQCYCQVFNLDFSLYYCWRPL